MRRVAGAVDVPDASRSGLSCGGFSESAHALGVTGELSSELNVPPPHPRGRLKSHKRNHVYNTVVLSTLDVGETAISLNIFRLRTLELFTNEPFQELEIYLCGVAGRGLP
jgi:hypothetical protein